jgi:hypothetical protein
MNQPTFVYLLAKRDNGYEELDVISWFCPLCNTIADYPKIWVSFEGFSNNYLLMNPQYNPSICQHFQTPTVTCLSQQSLSTAQRISIAEFQTQYPESRLPEYLDRIREDDTSEFLMIRSGILTVTQMTIDDNQPNPDSPYKKTWIDGVCQECNTSYHTWAFL